MKDFINQEFAAGHVWRRPAPAGVRFDYSPEAPPEHFVPWDRTDSQLVADVCFTPHFGCSYCKTGTNAPALGCRNCGATEFQRIDRGPTPPVGYLMLGGGQLPET